MNTYIPFTDSNILPLCFNPSIYTWVIYIIFPEFELVVDILTLHA